MAKKKTKSKRAEKSAVRKVGKITFLYFSGDVGEFIDALTSMVKDPKVKQQLIDAMSHVTEAASQAGVRLDGQVSP